MTQVDGKRYRSWLCRKGLNTSCSACERSFSINYTTLTQDVSKESVLVFMLGCLPGIGGVFQSAPEIILVPLAPPSYLANHLARRSNVNRLFLMPAEVAPLRAALCAAAAWWPGSHHNRNYSLTVWVTITMVRMHSCYLHGIPWIDYCNQRCTKNIDGDECIIGTLGQGRH